MNINRDNYEAWLLDLVEGRLTPEQEQKLHDFLLLNPDCAPVSGELESWDLDAWELEVGNHATGDFATGPMSFSGKSDLKKELPHPGSLVSEKHFDMFSIARMEGDLTDRQVDDHQRIVDEDIAREEEWLGWKQIQLVANPVVFKEKDKLKRKKVQRSRVLWISIASAAAAIFLFFAIFISDQGEPVSGELVSLEKELFPDSELSPDSEMSPDSEESTDSEMEQKTIKEGRVLSRDTEISKTPASRKIPASRKTPASGTYDTGVFSIKKHQDPPELTGERSDTVYRKVKEEILQPGPVRIAMLEKALMPIVPGVEKDRIDTQNLSVLSADSGKSSIQQFSEKGLRQSYRDFLEENDISLLTIASAGIEGINLLAGSDLSLNLSRDEKGRVSGFRFRGDHLSVDTPIKKAE